MMCENCGRPLETQEERDKELCANCSPNYTCYICGKTFGTEWGYKAHMGFHKHEWIGEDGKMNCWK